jgi:DNA-directed RNA polymerase subunit A"
MSKGLQKEFLDKIVLPKKIEDEVEDVAAKLRLNKTQKSKLVDEVKKSYMDGNFEPGEVFGIIAAQSISEPATQMTMRTYHFAGSAGIKVTYGLPRLIEIFDAKRKPDTPMMTIFLEKKYNNRDSARKIAEDIIEKSIEVVAKKISINLNEESIDIELLDARSAEKIASVLKEKFKNLSVRTKSGIVTAKIKEELEIKELQKIKEKIMDTRVEGIKNITNAVVRREGNDWVINTIGSNLEGILNMKGIDKKRTVTNDIHETAKILGIEAARSLIIREALNTLQDQGLDVDIRHVMLVADIMTMTGEVKSIGRYGVAGAKTSILARAAFEETIKHLVRASIRNEVDNFNGIFENVMVGQVIPSGTGMFDLVAKFEESEEEEKK